MGQYRTPTLEEVVAAKRAGAERLKAARAVAASFDAGKNLIVLELDRGGTIAFEVAIYRYLAKAAPADLAEIEILGGGAAINFPRIDVSLSVGALIADWRLAPNKDGTTP